MDRIVDWLMLIRHRRVLKLVVHLVVRNIRAVVENRDLIHGNSIADDLQLH